jgi:hypothetical protein
MGPSDDWTHLKLASKWAWVSLDGLVGDFDFILLIFPSIERKTGWQHRDGHSLVLLATATLFYFTDNMVVSYYVVQNGSSSNPELHCLIRAIKTFEVLLGCQIEGIPHVPGVAMIDQENGGLRRALRTSARRFPISSLMTAEHLLRLVMFLAIMSPIRRVLIGLHLKKSTSTGDGSLNAAREQN